MNWTDFAAGFGFTVGMALVLALGIGIVFWGVDKGKLWLAIPTVVVLIGVFMGTLMGLGVE